MSFKFEISLENLYSFEGISFISYLTMLVFRRKEKLH
jgi:hypothetical protein